MKMTVTTTPFRVGVVLTALLLHLALLVTCTGENDDVGLFESTHRHRSLAGAAMITTTACNVIRSQTDYQARLDLIYFYLVECNAGTVPDLEGIERAVATSIASRLNDCNEENSPLYAVQVTGTGHRVSTGGVCDASQAGDQCHVIRGQTSIFLDNGPSEVEFAAYEEIESTLNNTDLLNQFTNTSLVSAELIRRIGENLVILNDQTPSSSGNGAASDQSTNTSSSARGESLGSVTTKIAVAVACIAFTLTTLFIYGVLRQKVAAVQVGNPNAKMRLAHLQAKRRKFWNNLEEGNQSPGYMVTDHPLPSITWSVSDLTSDSASIRSALKMDRIEEDSKEGDASMETDEEVNSTESVEKKGPPIAPPAKKNKSPKKLNPSILENYIPAHWKDKTETRGIKLGSVWDLAGMPESYFGDSDPEAETPVRSNSIKDFDVTTGSYGACPFMDDYSLEDESADVQLQFDLDKHNITDPTEDSENLRKIVATVTKDDAQDGDEIRHSLALTITGEEEEDDDNDTITPSSTSEGTDSGEEKRVGWPVTEEEDESSASFKDAEQTWIDSSDASTQPHEVAVVNVEHSVSPDIAWPRAHAKGEWTQIEDSTTVKVAHAHAKGEWAQTKGSSAIKVEYLQFFTPELGKVTNEMNKVIMGAPKPAASSKKQDGFNLQPTKAASMSRLVAPPIPSPDGSVTDERKVEAHNNAPVASSKQLDLFSPQPSMPRVKGAAHDESASDDDDESKVVKEVPRSTPNTPFKALDDAASVSSEKASPLPTQDENVTDNRSTPITFSKALDFPIPQPSNNAASVVSPEKMSSMPTQDENVTDDVSKVVKELLNFSIPQPPSKAASIGCFSPEKASTTQDENAIIDQSNIVVRKATRSSSSSSSTLVALSKETTGSMSSPSLELLSPISLQDFASPDNSILKSWAQSVMNKLKTDKDQKLLSM